MQLRKFPYGQLGFSLVELVLVISITGILSAVIVPLVTKPAASFVDVSRRTTLVDAAESAIQRMQRDIHRALPNSIRIKNGTLVEFLYAVDGGRYRFGPDSTDAGADLLDFTTSDTSFDVIGTLQNFSAISPGSDSVVIYNLTPLGANLNAYVGDNRVLLAVAGNTASHLALGGGGIQFPLSSPAQRFFIVSGPTTYACDLVNGFLERYSGYPFSVTQPDPPAAIPARTAEHVSACSFVYNPGSAERSGLLTISLELSDSGEKITLLHQVHVDNTP